MHKVLFNAFLLLLGMEAIGLFSSCSNDELPPPQTPEFCDTIVASYNTNVKTIIDESCAYSGCHDGSGGLGPGNYNSYNGLTGVLDAGTFRSRVIGLKEDATIGMPPNQSVYAESKKDDLTEEELRIIECWLDVGYPED